MPDLCTSPSWRALALTLALMASLLPGMPPAFALDEGRSDLGPVEEPGPLNTPPPEAPELRPLGNGEVLPHTHQGNLGSSGLKVSCSPAMIQVLAIDPGSPAALADVPNPARVGRVRLVAVNGLPVEAMGRLVLLAAFHPSRGKVQLTFARPAQGEPGESLVGPYELPLSVRGMAEQRADWLAAQQRFAEAVGHLLERNVDASTVAEALLLGAQDAAAAEDWPRALNLASAVPPSHPLHAQALGLKNLANDRVQRLVLRQAQHLTEAGQHQEALRMLEGLSPLAPYAGWRRDAELKIQGAWMEAQHLRRNRGLPTPPPWNWSPATPKPSPASSTPVNLNGPNPSPKPNPVPPALSPRPHPSLPPLPSRPAAVVPLRPSTRPPTARIIRPFRLVVPTRIVAPTRPLRPLAKPVLPTPRQAVPPRPQAQSIQPRPTRRPR